jgi:DNA mismatch repair protein MutL
LGSALLSGTTLGVEEMSALLDQLVMTSDPFQSPFGKPALLRLPLDEIHRRFKRAE